MIRTLVDLVSRMRRLGEGEAYRFFNGYRTWKIPYSEFLGRIGGMAEYLDRHEVTKSDRLLLWGENRPEWAIAFWAAVVRGIELVPIDFRSSAELAGRILEETKPKLVVYGEQVNPASLSANRLSFPEIQELNCREFQPIELTPDDIVEIVYTSGTTSNPKGVVHRHRNLCANLNPVREEIHRYRTLAAPFQPIRILDLLPLSHMFGQVMGLFVPVLLGGSTVFVQELGIHTLIDTVSREKVSVLVSVPRILDQFRNCLEHTFDLRERRIRTRGLLGVAERWLRYFHFHRAMGLKFWAVVVGGARLEKDLESFFSRLGILLIQGYGLTEASPIVALNHPLSAKGGSIGRPLQGQEVRIAGDGEILVRGESIVYEYVGDSKPSNGVLQDGWLHTGDMGEFDEEGNLYFKGRKADVIVTSEGLNVFPEDIERILNSFPEVRESVVVALRKEGREEAHAVLLLEDDSIDLPGLIRRANQRLESYQSIRDWSIWPKEDFPRTSSTFKIKRREVAQVLSAGSKEERQSRVPIQESLVDKVESLAAKISQTPLSALSEEDRLEEDLGLSSLDRIELLSTLQRQSEAELDETTFAELTTVGQIRDWVEQKRFQKPSSRKPSDSRRTCSSLGYKMPLWTKRLPVRLFREMAQAGLILPLFRSYIRPDVSGLEQLDGVQPPVVFVANHTSDLDTVAILAALPRSWRRRLAPAARQEHFEACFPPQEPPLRTRIRKSFEYYAACALFNTYLIPQRMAGLQKALRYSGILVESGYCPLLYPEGGRTRNGQLQPFSAGIGLMAIRLGIGVLPIYLSGLFQVLSIHDRWPKPGQCSVRFGSLLKPEGERDFLAFTRRVEKAVQELKKQEDMVRRTPSVDG